MKALTRLVCLTALTVSVLAGCRDGNGFLRDPDTETIRATLKTAVPLAHYAAISMASVQGVDIGGVTTTNTCVDYPCPALVSIDPHSQGHPFIVEQGGTVMVAGLWTSSNDAILTVSFVDMRVGVPTFSVSKISTVPVVGTDDPSDGYTIVYANVDVNVDMGTNDPIELSDTEVRAEYDRLNMEASDDPEVNLDMDTWIIRHLDGGTPYDFTDDTYAISGGGQYVDVVSGGAVGWTGMIQLGMVGVQVTPECLINPTSGLAVMQEAGTSIDNTGSIPVLGQATILCESSCNGMVRVLLSTGNYVGAVGSSIPLNLTQF